MTSSLYYGDRKKIHSLSIEMKSKKRVKHVLVSDEFDDRVLFERFPRKLEEISMVEGCRLEGQKSKRESYGRSKRRRVVGSAILEEQLGDD